MIFGHTDIHIIEGVGFIIVIITIGVIIGIIGLLTHLITTIGICINQIIGI
jgi:hypothetical protein